MSRSTRVAVFPAPVPYAEGLELQEALWSARREERIPDTVLLLQHRPVVTLGRRGRDQHLLANPAQLRARGLDLFTAPRGGDVTYHGPGQWVLYPILRLTARDAGAHGYLWQLEETALRAATRFGVETWRRVGKSGAWTKAGKIAAIGFRIRRWITSHGMSFNVEGDLAGFSAIVPCGLTGEPVGTLETCLGGRSPGMPLVGEALLEAFADVFHRTLDRVDPRDLP